MALPTDIDESYQRSTPLFYKHGLQLEYSNVSCDQNNHDSSGVYVLYIYYGLSVKINTCENPNDAPD